MPADGTTEFGGWPRLPRWVWLATGVAAVAVLAGLAVARSGPHHATSASRPKPHPAWVVKTSGGVDALAVGGRMLYVATGDYPAAALSVFNRATGQLVHRIAVPAKPLALRAGPGGSVWLTFYSDQGGGTGLWLLSPDLGKHSSLNPRAARSMSLSDVLPVGPAAALVAANGLADLHMPVPGHPGQAILHRVPTLPTGHGYRGAIEFARLAGRLAAVQNNNSGHYRIVVAGRRGPGFEPGPGVSINSMASSGNSLWITTGALGTGPMSQAVTHLNDRLQVVTSRAISKNPVFAFSESVWATGNTVVVSTLIASEPLVCFRFHNGHTGPVTSIPARLPPGDLAVTGGTVYAADAWGVVLYHLPPACR